MAEIVAMSGKGRRGRRGAAASERKPRKRRVKGYGVDRLRIAAERRVAQSSEELAELLMTKALEGKLESVKMLMKLAEEEKERKEDEDDGGRGILAAMGYRMVEPKVGDVWVAVDGRTRRRERFRRAGGKGRRRREGSGQKDRVQVSVVSCQLSVLRARRRVVRLRPSPEFQKAGPHSTPIVRRGGRSSLRAGFEVVPRYKQAVTKVWIDRGNDGKMPSW